MVTAAKLRSFSRQVGELVLLLVIVFLIRTFIFGLYQVPTGSMETTMLVGERFFADKASYWLRKPRRGEIVALIQPTYQFKKGFFGQLFERYVWGPQNWTKRIIALPGQHVQGIIEDGKPVVYIDGQKISEPYLNTYPLIMVDETRRSYDPSALYTEQPFYQINPANLILDPYTGNPITTYPDEAHYSSTPSALRTKRFWDGSDEFDVQLGPDEYWLMGDNRRGSDDSRYFGPVKEQNIFARIIFRIWSVDSNESWWILDLIKHPVDFWKRIRWNRFFQVLH